MERYMSKYLIYSLLWSLTGDSRLKVRTDLGEFIRGITTVPLPPPNHLIIDYEVSHSLFLSLLF
jgi:dynein heavy chain 1